MFAHSLEEQIKEPMRQKIFSMLYEWDDLSEINLNEDKILLEELVVMTRECKNCMGGKCPGGYNCKFGVCVRENKICYNDLMYGKCYNMLMEYETKRWVDGYGETHSHIPSIATGFTDTYGTNVSARCGGSEGCAWNTGSTTPFISEPNILYKCIHGIHLTEKKLIPYNQRMLTDLTHIETNFLMKHNASFNAKSSIISICLNDQTIRLVKDIVGNKLSRTELISELRAMSGLFDDEKDNVDADDDPDVLADIVGDRIGAQDRITEGNDEC